MATPLTDDDPRHLGEFRIVERIGEGGQGIVYRGLTVAGEPVAVKVLRLDADPAARQRLARELEAVGRVAPFCTARVLAAAVDGPTPYVVSEFVDGPSVADRVIARGPLPDGELDRLIVGTATALMAIHGAGVLHRDFKPENILLGPDGPRIVDFGIARHESTATLTSGLIGTPAYLAPEQLAGQPASFASDIFAWGATMVFAATGRAAFGNDSIAAVLHRIAHLEPDLSGVPDRFRDQLHSCLAKNPAMRPAAGALVTSLVDPSGRPGVAHHRTQVTPTIGRPPGTVPGPAPARGRRRLVGAIGVGLAMVLVAVLAAVIAVNLVGDGTPPDTATGGTAGTEPADGNVIPTEFDGTWAGNIRSNSSNLDYDIEIMLPAGRDTGSWSEPANNCTGELSLVEVRGDELRMRLTTTAGCVPGDVTLTRDGERLGYDWQDDIGLLAYTGTLERTG